MKIFKLLITIFILISFGKTYAQETVTFSEHIYPIVLKNCAPCHKNKSVAPFPLLTYEDVAKRGKMIQYVTGIRYMPPWKADPTYHTFANEKILTDSEIQLIKSWVELKMPKGKEQKLAKELKNNSSLTKKPDLTLSYHRQFKIHGDAKENFVMMIIPFELDKEYNVESIEYFSDNFKVVHHSNFGIYQVDEREDISADTLMILSENLSTYANRYAQLTQNLVYYNGWVPGSSPVTFAKGLGFKMPKKGVIVLTNHYAPSYNDELEKSFLNFHFTQNEIKRKVETLSIGSGGIGQVEPSLILLPGDVKTFRIRMEIVEPLSLMYVWPHMHLLGKKFKAYYTTNTNDTVPLIRINEWDFNWQEAYKYKTLKKLPAGCILTIEGTYDNTNENPANPFSPPRVIFSDGLMGTNNEMLSLIIVYLPYKEGDESLEL